jgi:hypothetical protein
MIKILREMPKILELLKVIQGEILIKSTIRNPRKILFIKTQDY